MNDKLAPVFLIAITGLNLNSPTFYGEVGRGSVGRETKRAVFSSIICVLRVELATLEENGEGK